MMNFFDQIAQHCAECNSLPIGDPRAVRVVTTVFGPFVVGPTEPAEAGAGDTSSPVRDLLRWIF